MIWILVFWTSVFLLLYVYVGYPAAIRALASLRARPIRHGDGEPLVTVLVVAHDEARRIAARIENVLGLDYPGDRLEIIVASDGSTDDTVALARTYEPAGVSVVAFELRRGKPAVLSDVIPKARGEIVVLADARQRFEPNVVRALVRPFADPEVGAVSGELMLGERPGATSVGHGVGFYWRYEKLIRHSESDLDSTIGATGAVYAIRRELFEPIPVDTVLDDVLIPLRIARRGFRVLFEPAARAHDVAPATAREEFARKVRTLAGNFQLFWRERWLLNPFGHRLWLQAVSHKGLRLLGPVLMAAALISNLALAAVAPYGWLLLGQLAFYAAAAGGYALGNARGRARLLSVPYVMCLLNVATVVGFFRFASGRQRATWDRAGQ